MDSRIKKTICPQTVRDIAGFRPGRRGPFLSGKGPKTIDAPPASSDWTDAAETRAGQLATLRQGPPNAKNVRKEGGRQASETRRKRGVRGLLYYSRIGASVISISNFSLKEHAYNLDLFRAFINNPSQSLIFILSWPPVRLNIFQWQGYGLSTKARHNSLPLEGFGPKRTEENL
jgi:hypothetical protein